MLPLALLGLLILWVGLSALAIWLWRIIDRRLPA